MMEKKRLITLLAVIFTVWACSKNSDPEPEPPNEIDCTAVSSSFSADVFPIISTNCATNSLCHGPGSVQGPGELTNYTQIRASAGAVRTAVTSESMPPGRPLSKTDQDIISCWVLNGSPND